MLDITCELAPVETDSIEVSHPGYITLKGDAGQASSHDVEQPSMVLVDMVQFMGGVRMLFTGDAQGFRMMAQGSSFELAFQQTGHDRLAIAAMGELIEHGDVRQMAGAIHHAAAALWTDARDRLPADDPAHTDIEREFDLMRGFLDTL